MRMILIVAMAAGCGVSLAEDLPPLPPLPPPPGQTVPPPVQPPVQAVEGPIPDGDALPSDPPPAATDIPSQPQDVQSLRQTANAALADIEALEERLKQSHEALKTADDPDTAEVAYAAVLNDFMGREMKYIEAMIQLVEALPEDAPERRQAGETIAAYCERRTKQPEVNESRLILAYYLHGAGRANALNGEPAAARRWWVQALASALSAQAGMEQQPTEEFCRAVLVRTLHLLLNDCAQNPDEGARDQVGVLYETSGLSKAFLDPVIQADTPVCLRALWPTGRFPPELLGSLTHLLRKAPDSAFLQDAVAEVASRDAGAGRPRFDLHSEWLIAHALFSAGHRNWVQAVGSEADVPEASAKMERAIEQARLVVRRARAETSAGDSATLIAKAYQGIGLAHLRMNMPLEALAAFSSVPATEHKALPFFTDFLSWASQDVHKQGIGLQTSRARREEFPPPSAEAREFFAALGKPAPEPGSPVLSAWPGLVAQDPGGPGETLLLDRHAFQWRSDGGRRRLVARGGGSRATESAVDAALRWLAGHQEADGHWDTAKQGSAQKTDTACTGLALLAFLSAGNTEMSGRYKDTVRRAVAWLKSRQNADGLVFDVTDAGGHRGIGYPHAIAGLALVEAAGMGRVADTRAAAQKAVDYSTRIHQQGEGYDKRGFRYRAKDPGDLSVTGWFVLQLKSAKVAGLNVDHGSFEGAIKFLDSVERKEGGVPSIYSYQPGIPHDHTAHRLTAIGNLCRCLLGWEKKDLEASVAWFVAKGGRPDGWGEGKTDLYYWHYGTLCVFQMGGDLWKQWNEAMKKTLCETQRRGGDEDGSWDPVGDYANDWGRVGQTALATLCLEVYYRYPRMYKE